MSSQEAIAILRADALDVDAVAALAGLLGNRGRFDDVVRATAVLGDG